jgi:transcriptional regulator with XRE-family HTH domain
MDADIAERLKDSRNKAGMSQEKAAEEMEMSRPTLSAIESGKRIVTAEDIIRFAELYSVSASYLLYGEEKEESQTSRLLAYDRLFSELKAVDQRKILSLMKKMEEKK